MDSDLRQLSDGTYINIVGLIQQAYLVVWIPGSISDDIDDERIVINTNVPPFRQTVGEEEEEGYVINANNIQHRQPLKNLLHLVLAANDQLHFERKGNIVVFHPDVEDQEHPWTSEVGTLIHAHFIDQLREFLPQGDSYLGYDWDEPTLQVIQE